MENRKPKSQKNTSIIKPHQYHPCFNAKKKQKRIKIDMSGCCSNRTDGWDFQYFWRNFFPRIFEKGLLSKSELASNSTRKRFLPQAWRDSTGTQGYATSNNHPFYAYTFLTMMKGRGFSLVRLPLPVIDSVTTLVCRCKVLRWEPRTRTHQIYNYDINDGDNTVWRAKKGFSGMDFNKAATNNWENKLLSST